MIPLISFNRLSKVFSQRGGFFENRTETYAVRDFSLDIARGETLGVVGESGCGKSTLGRMAVGLLEPSAGDVLINGKALYNSSAHTDYKAFRKSLSGVVQMIFQDPYSSLNPRMRIGESVAEPLRCSHAWLGNATAIPSKALIRRRMLDILQRVGLEAEAAARYPHEFSGGQRQRIAIARALITHPDFVVCDEPTSSLDASVQSQVLNLLRELQDDLKLTYCFISHDLAVVRHMSDKVAVMYKGLLVEFAKARELFNRPCHPYTRLLLDSVPAPVPANPEAQDACPTAPLSAPAATPPEADGHGCPFAPRCPKGFAACLESVPKLAPAVAQGKHLVRCHLFDKP